MKVISVVHNADILVDTYQFHDSLKKEVVRLLSAGAPCIPQNDSNVKATLHTIWDWEPNNIKFRNFSLGLLGIIPGTFLYCSIGSLAKSLQDLKNVQSPNNFYMTIVGIISTFLVLYFSAKYSRDYFENS